MLVIDKEQINADKRQLPLHPDLEVFATQVSFVKPLCKFVLSTNCHKQLYVDGTWVTKFNRLHVYQNGDKIGEVFVEEQSKRGAPGRETVYGVKSFRIEKQRGTRDEIFSRDMKVALRTAKKMFVARGDDELRTLIDNTIAHEISSVAIYKKRALHGCVDEEVELNLYMLNAFKARKENRAMITVPTNLVTVKNIAEHDRQCEEYLHIKALLDMYKSKQGYGVKIMNDNSLAVLDYTTLSIVRYPSFDKLPDNIQTKFAMFKVLNKGEPYAHLGCKFKDDILYIAGGA